MTPIGMISEEQAQRFVAQNGVAELGSMSQNGMRRINSAATGSALAVLQMAFAELPGAVPAGQSQPDVGQCTPCQQQAIGDRLAQIIKGHRPNETPCAECLAEIERLNNMTPEQVMAEAEEIASQIVARAADGATSPIDRLVARALPSIPTAVVSGWIQQAVRQSRESNAGAVDGLGGLSEPMR